MRRLWRITAMLCILTCCWVLCPPPTEAQWIVEDPGAIAQLILTVEALLEITGLKVQDLAALGSFATVIEIATELTILAAQIEGIADMIEARAEGWRGRMATVPCRARDWQDWLYDASAWGREGAHEALFALTLIRRSVALMQTVLRLVQAIESLIGGTTSGLQSVSALASVTIAELQKLHAATAAYQETMIGREIIHYMGNLARRCIAANRYRTWGTFTEY